MLNSTDRATTSRYSSCMSQEPFIDEGFAERWAAWQARGAANDRATTRRLYLLAFVAILLAAIFTSLWWL